MEKYLVDVVVISQLGEVTGNSDAFLRVITGTKTRFCVVERETPRLIKVESDEGICPHCHPVKFSHVFRVSGEWTWRGKLSTVSGT